MSQELSPKLVQSTEKEIAEPKKQSLYNAPKLDSERYYESPLEFSESEQAIGDERASRKRELGPVANALLWAEPIWVALLAPLLLLPGQFLSELFHPIVVAGLFFFWPIRLLLQHRITPRTTNDGLLALLLLLVPLSIWVSPNRDTSWIAAGYLLLGVAVYISIVNWPVTTKYPWLVGAALCGIGVALAAIGPQILANAPTKLFDNPDLQASVNQARAMGIETVNPNILAGGLVFVLPLLVSLTLQKNLIWGTGDDLRDSVMSIVLMIVCGIMAVAVAIVIVLTQSRGAYVAGALSCWLVFVLRWPRIWFVWLFILLGGSIAIFWVGLDQFLSQSIYDHSINSYEGRTEIWKRGIEAIYDFPITGIGLNIYEYQISRLYPFSMHSAFTQPHAHNMLIQIGIDLGLLGLASLVGILVGVIMMFGRTIQAFRHRHGGLNCALAIGGIGAIVAMLVHGIFDSALWGTKLSPLPWIVYGLAVVLPKEAKSRKRRRRSQQW